MSSTLAVALALFLVAIPARAQDAHGAITFGQTAEGKAVAYGFAWNYAARDEARAAAMSACITGGGMNCVELAVFQNGCGALAMDRHGVAQGTGGLSQEQAETHALRACEAAAGNGCAVVGSQCASPDGRASTWSGGESILAAQKQSPRRRPTVDRLVKTEAPPAGALPREQRIQVQRGLAALGFDAGPADGMFGPRTRAAIREWQSAKGLEATGHLTGDEAEALAASAREDGRRPTVQKTAKPEPEESQTLNLAAAGPKCAGMLKGSRCWAEISNKPGCFVWTRFIPSGTLTKWTGECVGDTAHGKGTLHWKTSSVSGEATGEIVLGKRRGQWVENLQHDWHRGNGFYVDGNRHGRWIYNNRKTGQRLEITWRNGSYEGQPGVLYYSWGGIGVGRWHDECLVDKEQEIVYFANSGTLENCRRKHGW